MRFFSQRSLLNATADALLAEAEDYDLSPFLVLVPTAEAGRRLVEALAMKAAEQARALFAPRVITPRQLPGLLIAKGKLPLATPAACLAAWNVVLESAKWERFKALFPITPQSATAWRQGMAKQLFELQQQLAEGGWSFEKVASACDEIPQVERARWSALAQLESEFKQVLEQLGWRDVFAAERAILDGEPSAPPPPIQRIILCAVPSPLPLVVRYLERLSDSGYPIEVWVAASEDEADTLDRWGRPLDAHWTQCPLSVSGALESIQLHAVSRAPQGLTQYIRKAVEAGADTPVIGVVDPALIPAVAQVCRQLGFRPNDPSGKSLAETALGRALVAWIVCAEDATVARVRTLLQSPLVWSMLAKQAVAERHGFVLTQEEALKQLDRLVERHLAQTLDDLLHFSNTSSVQTSSDFFCICQLLVSGFAHIRVGKPQRVEWLGEWLADCVEMQSTAEIAREEVESMRRLLEEMDALEKNAATRNLSAKAAFAEALLPILTERLRSLRVYIPDPEADVDLLGWLELPWITTQHLLLCGLNEGVVPQSVRGDLFLPESLRGVLGLTTNEQRYASDSLLFAIVQRKLVESGASAAVYVPKAAADGSPLRPSRLLFRCDDATLLQRTRVLFGAEAVAEVVPVTSANTLLPLRAPGGLHLPESLSFSALGDYLRCPFRFFLTHILGMRESRHEAMDMDLASFGTVLHAACNALQDRRYEQLKDEQATARHLLGALDRELRERFGGTQAFSLAVQRSLLESRLQMLATVMAERAEMMSEGSVLATETKVSLQVSGMELRGRIDRIDRVPRGVALVDYKTSKKAKPPLEAHWSKMPRSGLPEHVPESARCVIGGEEGYWTDLQLPLYALAMETEYGFPIEAAYCNLPDSVEKAGWAPWVDWSRDVAAQALACATDVVERIQEGVFWPPNKTIPAEWDVFDGLFPEGVEVGFDGASLSPYRFAARRDDSHQSTAPANNTQIE
jgi:ATP-dependent helicase/nuclease subunit B